MAGKGDTYRPVDVKRYEENFDRIFRKKNMCVKCGGLGYLYHDDGHHGHYGGKTKCYHCDGKGSN